MLYKFKRFIPAGAVAAATLGAANVANAAVDVSAVVTEIQDAVTPIASIGGAVLVVMVTAAVYRWVRKAL